MHVQILYNDTGMYIKCVFMLVPVVITSYNK